MCQSTVLTRRGDGTQVLMEDVCRLEVRGDTVSITPLFGAPVEVRGRVERIDLMEHRIVLDLTEPPQT